MFRIEAIDHVVIRARDLEGMVRFYRDALGCAVDRRRDDLGLVHMRAGLCLIDLLSAGGTGAQAGEGAGPDGRGHNMAHLCLRIDPFDYHELSAHFRGVGVEVGPEERNYGAEGTGPSVYLRDPEGNVIELKGRAREGPG